jgi:hypothetical protein
MIHFVTVSTQDNCMRDYLSLWGRALQPRVAIVYYEDLLAQATATPGTYILAALDQLDAHSLALLTDMHRLLSGRPGFRFVNDPERTLRRYPLLEALHKAGLNDFRAVRATGDLDALSLPIFLRGESRHDGSATPLLRTRREVDGGLALAAARLGSLDDVLAIEFCPTCDESGVYRKYAAFFVGERVVPRSLFHGRNWMLKQAATDFSRERSLEELEYVIGNPHERQLSRIRELAGVGYGRIDYSIKDGRVQTWEINLKPTIGRGALRPRSGRVPRELEAVRRQVKEVFYRGFEEALEALEIDRCESPGMPVLVRAARGRLPPIATPPPMRMPRLKRWLRPIWPTLVRLDRVARHVRDRLAIHLLAPAGRRLRASSAAMDSRSG